MPEPSLLSINPDQLFEHHSVHEIEDINKKIQYEIERKREELRTMVGERYRDLLQAADTIREMTKTSSDVIHNIENIKLTCKKVHDNQHLGLRTEHYAVGTDKGRFSHSHQGIVVQVKLLTSLPETIWTRLENKEYLVAAQLFLFARHISTGLHLGMSNNASDKAISQWFPLAQRQWSAMAHFKDTIINACELTLSGSELDSMTASQCLSSLCLLQNSPSSALLTLFISLRLGAVFSVLDSSNHNKNVKTLVMDSVQILSETLELVYTCFIHDSPLLLHRQLELIISPGASPSVSLAGLDNSAVNRALPDVIAKYKPNVDISENTQEDIQVAMSDWLEKVESFSGQQLNRLIDLVTSVKSLHSIRQQAVSIDKPENWESICEKLFVPKSLDIYMKYYQPLITKRVQCLINNAWEETLNEMKTKIRNSLKINKKKPESDLRWLVWYEEPNDVHNKQNDLGKNRNLLMKTRGLSQNVVTLCKDFDKFLEDLLDDLKLYLYGEAGSIKSSGNAGPLYLDRDDIVIYLQQCTVKYIKLLTSFIKVECLNTDTCVMLSRFLQSVSHLCPSLKKCFPSNKSDENWNRICDELNSSSLECWEHWLKNMKEFLDKKINVFMPSEFNLRALLTILPKWDTIKIEEKDDQDKAIESIIQIPSQPSLPLQQILNKTNLEINKIIPHTLPQVIHQKLIEQTARILLNCYKNMSAEEIVQTNQVCAVQFYLDVKYLQMLMVIREDKGLVELAHNVNEVLKLAIDPFDFDVFYPHLQENIKRSVQKTQCQFGCLVGKPDYLASILGSHPPSVQGDPSVIALSSCQSDSHAGVIWFPLLPVTTPLSYNTNRNIIGNVDKTKVRKSVVSSPKNKQGVARPPAAAAKDGTGSGIVRSGAAAFFGAMSQDWFGTS